jgi:iron complex transport system permease protein
MKLFFKIAATGRTVARNNLGPLLLAGLVIVSVLSLLIGRYPIPASDVVGALLTSPFGGEVAGADNEWIVINILRMPRIFLVVMSGFGLAVAGGALQGLFRNPLVGPEIMGISAGASFGGVLAIALGHSATPVIIASAFLFGCGALVLAFALSRLARQSSILGLVLAGVVISGLFGALTGISTYLADPETRVPNIVYWLMGSFASASYNNAAFQAIVTLVCVPPLIGLSWRINVLSLGETDASALGLKVNTMRWAIILLVALIVAAQVAVSGGVGWVGLIIPHLARMMVGPDHVKLLPVAGLLGAIYLLLMDDLARSLLEAEIPIGFLTSLVGTPVFALFFVKLKGKGWSDG